MPTVYKRKCPQRGSWSQESLTAALHAVNTGQMGTNEASRKFGVPSRTLRRRKTKNNSEKTSLGPKSLFGKQNEEKLVVHIQKMQSRGFSPTRDDLRHIAFKFANALGINHKFDNDKERAGYDWLNSFLRRNPTLSIKKAAPSERKASESVAGPSIQLDFAGTKSEVLHQTIAEALGPSFPTSMNKTEKITPEKLQQQITPISQTNAVGNVRKLGRNVASILTSERNSRKKRLKLITPKRRQRKESTEKRIENSKKTIKKQRKKTIESVIENSSEEVTYHESDFSAESEDEHCGGCKEKYSRTKKQEDWLQCLYCKKWHHESCSTYKYLCDSCGELLAEKK